LDNVTLSASAAVRWLACVGGELIRPLFRLVVLTHVERDDGVEAVGLVGLGVGHQDTGPFVPT
jgi:hypothetical protein